MARKRKGDAGDPEETKAAEAAGAAAYDGGVIRAPWLDPWVRQRMEGRQVGESIPMLKAWSRGYDRALLAAPLPAELEEPEEPAAEIRRP
jgi:hypothetical protein